jgi:hypothetical protein
MDSQSRGWGIIREGEIKSYSKNTVTVL